jgi:hypothetical protein
VIALVASAWAGTWDVVVASRSDERFVVPTEEQRAAFSALVADVARAAPSGVLPATTTDRAAALGFALRQDGGVAVLSDAPGALRGAGVVAVRLGALPSELVLQAPHPFFDVGTGEIGAAMFDAGGVRALVVASANRDAAEGADPAHAPAGWFQSATDGLATALPRPLFVQVHGFGAKTSEACAVVSEGPTRLEPGRIERIALDLVGVLGCTTVRTGAEVPALAARTNAQGKLLVDRAAFLHLELAAGVREDLRAAAERRARLAGYLAALADGEGP